jgi:divalent metal cation (Fe/Co/Zn/Cd) transporter
VLFGVGAVVLTGWERLDPIIALLVAANIIWTGVKLLRRSALGLLDTALPAGELTAIRQVLDRYTQSYVQFHALRTRQAGTRRFVSVHVLAPGDWTVHEGHVLVEQIERDIPWRAAERDGVHSPRVA